MPHSRKRKAYKPRVNDGYEPSQFNRNDYRKLAARSPYLKRLLYNASLRDKKIRRALTPREQDILLCTIETLPLYMQEDSQVISDIVAWRLELGR